MTIEAAKVTELKPRQKKEAKPRIAPIQPSDVIDVYKLLMKSFAEYPHAYPDLDKHTAGEVNFQIYSFITQPGFIGRIVRVRNKPVGFMLGQEAMRPIGAPKRFMFLWAFYVDKEVRGQGVFKLLATEMAKEARSRGLEFWESNSDEQTVKFIQKLGKEKVRILHQRVCCMI